MATVLAYIEPVPGRLYPLVATLQELQHRGHRVVVRTGAAEIDLLRSVGIEADLLALELARLEPTDWQARTRFGALMRALDLFGQRARPQVGDLRRALEAEQPDLIVLVMCSTAFQNDVRLAEVACAAFEGQPFDVVLTTAEVDVSGLRVPANVRVERFVPHAPVPERLRQAVLAAIDRRAGAERVGAAFRASGGAPAAADALEQLTGVQPQARAPSEGGPP